MKTPKKNARRGKTGNKQLSGKRAGRIIGAYLPVELCTKLQHYLLEHPELTMSRVVNIALEALLLLESRPPPKPEAK